MIFSPSNKRKLFPYIDVFIICTYLRLQKSLLPEHALGPREKAFPQKDGNAEEARFWISDSGFGRHDIRVGGLEIETVDDINHQALSSRSR